MRFTIVREAVPYALPLAIAGAVFLVLGWAIPAAMCVAGAVFVLFFFRDPKRATPHDAALVLAPADGLVVGVTEVDEPDYLGARVMRVSIFMRLWDVHLTYAPVSGTVEHVAHRPGRLGNAGFARASEHNECNSIGVRGAGERLLFRQIAGVIARRIVCRVEPGDEVQAGDRVGLIKFGSRVDVFLPLSYEVLVRKGERVRGALTSIARRR